MHILLNAVAATAGGGVTYVRNVVPHLAAAPDVKLTVLIPPGLEELESKSNFRTIKFVAGGRTVVRFWHEQKKIPQLIARSGAEVLISAGNFALKRSPVPQILLSRNSLYTSRDFYNDLLRRHHYSIWLDTKLKGFFAKRSVRWADATVAPSEAFAQELRTYTGAPIFAIHHGFDQQRFFSETKPLSHSTQAELDAAKSCFRLLLMSHYNYYRNFETLLRGLAMAKKRAPEKKFKLFLTCKFVDSANPGSYRAGEAADLVRRLGIEGDVVELGAVPHDQVPNLYRACHAYATAAYAESFAHPLVEAMSCGLPIIASDIAVHREICSGGAIFFGRFSPEEFATAVLNLAKSQDLAKELSTRGYQQSSQFSWAKHAQQLVGLASSLLELS
jgi:glycosyltransferase involved in cell wall biosynthesis